MSHKNQKQKQPCSKINNVSLHCILCTTLSLTMKVLIVSDSELILWERLTCRCDLSLSA